jgi:hypothetical protein
MSSSHITRRRAIALSGGAAAGGLMTGLPFGVSAMAASRHVLRQHGKPAGASARASARKVKAVLPTVQEGCCRLAV